MLPVSDEQFLTDWQEAQEWLLIGDDGEVSGSSTVGREPMASHASTVQVCLSPLRRS